MKFTTTFSLEIQQDPVDKHAADKPDGGVPGRPSLVCYLVVLTATFCALVFYAQYAIQGNMASVILSSLPLLSSITVDENSGAATELPMVLNEEHAQIGRAHV